jgi:2-C-methyl-D-erythritol 4-phosphate cytidylyltransferase
LEAGKIGSKNQVNSMKTVAIIPAGGIGKRFNSALPKQFIELHDIPIIIRTLLAFENSKSVDSIVIAVPDDYKVFLSELIIEYDIHKVRQIVSAGAERQDSVKNALDTTIAQSSDIILIHDGVRPFVTEQLIENIIKAAIEYGAALPALTPKETIKLIGDDDFVSETLERLILRSVQTPQGFKTEIILKAYENSKNIDFISTDDAQLVEQSGFPVKVILGEEANIKITTQTDLKIAETFL